MAITTPNTLPEWQSFICNLLPPPPALSKHELSAGKALFGGVALCRKACAYW